jgi:hypothetical protein
MLKIFKNLIQTHRIGLISSKTLLWLYVKRDLPKLKGKLGIDLAGGGMKTKRFFSTKKYISVDIDQKKLDDGKKEHPDAIAVNDKIQIYMQNQYNEKPDVLVCLQTFGINTLFDHDETLDVAKMMHNFLKPGGSMILNAGEFLLDLDSLEKELTFFLKDKFKSIDKVFYGDIISHKQINLPWYIQLIYAYTMYTMPLLGKIFGIKQKSVYFCCKEKL